MGEIAISAENLSKRYRITRGSRLAAYRTLREEIALGARALLGGKSPNGSTKQDFWALKDIAFEIKEGSRVGVIGPNGAGKSTLLKILSRIVAPTTGHATVRGRLASLLEVGTGFHPELTGRENIYLNGTLLGMSRGDIAKAFDAIVDFAGIETFLDEPVKRYSSGMYTRLAFSVAAHLEPDILIVDEVLAVGDAAFQRKCIDRMKSLSQGGRTLVTVSHNMSLVSTLCDSGIVLCAGKLEYPLGPLDGATATYNRVQSDLNKQDFRERPPDGLGNIRLLSVSCGSTPEALDGAVQCREPLYIVLNVVAVDPKFGVEPFSFEIALINTIGHVVGYFSSPACQIATGAGQRRSVFTLKLSTFSFGLGGYTMNVAVTRQTETEDILSTACSVTVLGTLSHEDSVYSPTGFQCYLQSISIAE
jgi:lipopolysaccharide transport system ATP-binding protein